MSLPYFFENDTPELHSLFTLSEDSSKHCTQVLRMKTGEALQITNGKGDLFKASIVSEDKKKTVVKIEAFTKFTPPEKKISIAISLLKNASRFEWFLEKATEIGVHSIQPFFSARTEHHRFRLDRMQGILIAAMLQSQQCFLPELAEPIPFATLVSQSTNTQKLVAHCENGSKETLVSIGPANNTQILIGPEGDFTMEEIKLAIDLGYQPVSLGNTRLRAETAGMVAASILVNR